MCLRDGFPHWFDEPSTCYNVVYLGTSRSCTQTLKYNLPVHHHYLGWRISHCGALASAYLAAINTDMNVKVLYSTCSMCIVTPMYTIFLHVFNPCAGKHLRSDGSWSYAVLVGHHHHMLLRWISTVRVLYRRIKWIVRNLSTTGMRKHMRPTASVTGSGLEHINWVVQALPSAVYFALRQGAQPTYIVCIMYITDMHMHTLGMVGITKLQIYYFDLQIFHKISVCVK